MNPLLALVGDILGVDRTLVTGALGPGMVAQWDSMAHMQLVAAIEETYGVHFSLDEIPLITSVADIARLLAGKGVVL